MSHLHPVLTALTGLLFTGCVIGNDRFIRPSQLEQSWLVNRTRILGIRAEPPEITPGQRATFDALIGAPPGDEGELIRLWLACADGDAGCATDELAGLNLEELDAAALEELGFIGVEGFPGAPPPTYVAPADLLDGLEDRERLEGRTVTVQLTAFPTDQLEMVSETEEIDFNEIEAGFKRLVVSEATTPNNNPVLSAFTVDGVPTPTSDTVVVVDPGQSYDLGIFLNDLGGIEEYEFVNSDGELEQRVEEPYATWFSTGGGVEQSVTLWPFFQSTWVAPNAGGREGTWYVVVRDRRGGMSWWVQPWATAG